MVGVGNTALMGAAMVLKDPSLLEKVSEEAAACQTVDLNLSPSFSDKFMEYMMFPCEDA